MIDDGCATPWNSAQTPVTTHKEFFLSNNHIQTTSITKDLGAQFESNLKFKARINDIIIAPTSGQLLFIAPSCHVTLII